MRYPRVGRESSDRTDPPVNAAPMTDVMGLLACPWMSAYCVGESALAGKTCVRVWSGDVCSLSQCCSYAGRGWGVGHDGIGFHGDDV